MEPNKNIDWEQRKWQLASSLYISGYEVSSSIEWATDFIEEYKKSLNKEEK